MAISLVLKGLNNHSEAALSTLSVNVKERFGVVLPTPEKLLKGGECTIELRQEDFSGFSSLLTEAGIPVVINSQHDAPSAFENFFEKYRRGLENSLKGLNLSDLEDMVRDLVCARQARRTVYIFGNGGSASTASHFANDFSKNRFGKQELLFKVVCLNDCIPLMTALANDEGYQNVFSSQLNNLVESGDVVIAISSSGNSQNIVEGLKLANVRGAKTWAWVGFDGGKAIKEAQRHLYIPSKKGQYGFMEDVSLVVTHMLSVHLQEQDRLGLNKQ